MSCDISKTIGHLHCYNRASYKSEQLCADIVKQLPLHNLPYQHLKELKNGLIKGNFEEMLFVTASMKKASIKYEAFLHINMYLSKKNQCC
jgi:hypothetical protein